jgi:hypothetical protein
MGSLVLERRVCLSLRFVLLFDLSADGRRVYISSTLVQLRTSFPPAVDGADPGIFAALPAYETFGSVFDWSFLASAGSGVVIEWMRGQAQEL